jgi:DNA-binding transcriptional ArsR family regulator
MSYIDSAPPYVSQGVHRDAVLYVPQVVDLLVKRGISTTCAVEDSLILMRIWKWNWVNEQSGDLRRFAEEDEKLPWRQLGYDDLAAQLRIPARTVRRAVKRLEDAGLLVARIVGHPEHGSQKWYLCNWTTGQIGHPPSSNDWPDWPPPMARLATPMDVEVVETNVDPVQAIGSGSSLSLAAPEGSFDEDTQVIALCTQLAARVEQHRGTRPKVGPRWIKDMALLLRRGPKNVEGPPPDADLVRWVITCTFDDLAEPDRKGFCWADQIRSASALREHWDQLGLALKRRRPSASALDPSAMVSAVEQLKGAGL